MKPVPSPLSLGFISLGCAKNLVDSEHMMGVLAEEGIAIAPSPEEADIILVNTCAFIHDAKEESIDAILEACELKKRGGCRAVIVAGCLPQRYREELQKSLPEVDAFIGLDELDRVGSIVRRLVGGERGIFAISRAAHRVFEPKRPRMLLTGGPYAYVKIAEGCNHRCGFCAIPMIRGRYRSRPVARIVREAEHLLAHGVKELDLISQDTTWYGKDLGGSASLPRLLRTLGAIGGKFWIRLLYGYPSGITDDLLEAMAATSQVCRYLDIPIQHSHPDVLKAMRRSDSIKAVAGLPSRIRAALPGVTLRTTCLVGYPGETDSHFEHLLEFVKGSRFDHLGVFVFSPEEQTRAAGLPHPVPAEVAEARRDRLMRLQRKIVADKARQLVGAADEVLVERPATGRKTAWVGRSCRQAPEVDGETSVSGLPRGTHAGAFVPIRYVGARGYNLAAEAQCN